ncbi:MAG: N-acetyltransferase family protein [Pseudomonadota bacterium]
MEPIIRPATEADLPAIAAIWNPHIREGFVTFTTEEKTREGLRVWLRERAASDEAVLVAVDGTTVLGFAAYFPFRGGPGYRFTKEITIYCAPEAQGTGLGRRLLTTLEDDARSKGIHTFWSGCSAENPGSITFHEHIGYQHVARLLEVGYKFGRWLDLVLLSKRL